MAAVLSQFQECLKEVLEIFSEQATQYLMIFLISMEAYNLGRLV